MMKRKYISFITSSLLAIYFVLAPAMVSQNKEYVAPVEQGQEEDDKPEASISEVSLDVIIPSFTFDFGSDFAIFSTQVFEISIIKRVFLTVISIGFAHSYFEKIFERTIAPNAP